MRESPPLERLRRRRVGDPRPTTKRHGLSHGDRACLALGLGLALPVVTADGNWSLVAAASKVRVEQFR